MPHVCHLSSETQSIFTFEGIHRFKLHKYILNYTLVSKNNPYCALYFKSENQIKHEKLRQLTKYPYIVHPLSSFRQYYEFWLVILNVLIVVIKPLDTGIRDARTGFCPAPENFSYNDRDFNFRLYAIISTTVDALCWFDIIMQFFTGFEDEDRKFIDLRPSKIAKRYIFGPFFLIDMLNVIPRFTLRCFMEEPPLDILGMQNIFCLAKGVRFFTLLNKSLRVFVYLGVTSKGGFIAFYYLVITLFILHYITMVNIGLVRIIRVYFGYGDCLKVIKHEQQTLLGTYVKYMFRTTAYLLATSLPSRFYKNLETEENLVLGASYIIGKLYIIISWTIIATTILQTRSKYLKYQMLIDQVQEYMRNRNVPYELKQKILQHYKFKYQGKYFQENLVTYLISNQLRKEIKLHLCSSFMDKVKVFNDLSVEDVNEVTKVLIPEIILASDIICQAGTEGDCMYFIASGTVAVYTPSGQEVCHIQDGGYFGELGLLLESTIRPLTIIAIEHCKIYKMPRADVENTLFKNKAVYNKIRLHAKRLLLKAQKLEEEYTIGLMEERYSRNSSDLQPN